MNNTTTADDGTTQKIGFLHKLFGTRPGEDFQPKEALSYSIAGFGQNLVCGLVGSYITYYFTNALLMSAVTVGLIMLFTRLFDAFNDPIMGTIVDHTRTKDGKCRPYLKFTPIPIAIMTVLLFLPISPSSIPTAATVAIMTVIYVVWSVVYTIVDVPYWGLASSMTSDTNQRGTMLTVARLFCTLGGGVISILVPSLTSAWLKDYSDSSGTLIAGMEQTAAAALRSRFIILAAVIVLISIPTFYIGYKNSKERFQDTKETRKLSENLRLLFKNKPLLLIILSGVLGAAKGMYMYTAMFFASYNLTAVSELGFTVELFGMKGAGLATLITMAVVPGGLIASVLVPFFTKKIGKRNTYIWSHILGGVCMVGVYFVGWKSPVALIINLIGLVIAGIPTGFGNIITYAMIADTVDYLEHKEGVRAEGICFAMQTFINKIGMAVGAAFTCFGLSWAGIAADETATQTLAGNAGGLDFLYQVTVLWTGLSLIASAIPLFFYKFNEAEQAKAVAEIAERKALAAAASGEQTDPDEYVAESPDQYMDLAEEEAKE